MRLLTTTSFFIFAACASAADTTAGPGPMTPQAPDHELDAAPGLALDDRAAVLAWLDARLTSARSGVRERARLPLVRRAPLDVATPPFVIAAAADSTPAYPVKVVDLTSAGIPPGPWVGWVDGRFRAGDDGLPVFEVLRQTRRGPDKPAAVYVVRE